MLPAGDERKNVSCGKRTIAFFTVVAYDRKIKGKDNIQEIIDRTEKKC